MAKSLVDLTFLPIYNAAYAVGSERCTRIVCIRHHHLESMLPIETGEIHRGYEGEIGTYRDLIELS